MNARALSALVIAVLATAAFVLWTVPAMPERVATHFGAGNLANAWMSRDGYRIYMLAFAVAFPLLIALVVGGLPRLFPSAADIPNREYWLGGERRATALAYLGRQACRLGVLAALLGAGVHACIIAANLVQPPRLPATPFVAMLSSFFLALLWWILSVYRFFAKTGGARRTRARRASGHP